MVVIVKAKSYRFVKIFFLFVLFLGIIQILETRTSRRFLQSRLTPDMERKLVFFTSSVRFGHHKRYQEWFQNKVKIKIICIFLNNIVLSCSI